MPGTEVAHQALSPRRCFSAARSRVAPPSSRRGSSAPDWLLVLLCTASTAGCGTAADQQPRIESSLGDTLPRALWVDATDRFLPATAEWTNRVELADVDGDGRVDILFANGGNYSEPGEPEQNRVFLNRGPGQMFEEATERVFGPRGDHARVIKVRDINRDGLADILVGTTFQTQSRLYLGGTQATFREVTATHLPQGPTSVGDLELGDADGDGDLDVVLADWGPGNNMTNAGGRTRLWLNDGNGRFIDATESHMPHTLLGFSWDLEFLDFDNDFDLDIAVSCKRCYGGSLFVNNGSGYFEELLVGLPRHSNNYELEPMDVDGDGFLDLVTINDGEIVGEINMLRRQHVFRNDAGRAFVDATSTLWPDSENVGEDDNNAVFIDYDSDGDADFVVGSLTGADRLLVNDGTGRFTMADEVFSGPETAGTLSLLLADLDGDHRLDVVQGQGENPAAVEERIFLGSGLDPDTAPPVIGSIEMVQQQDAVLRLRARVHDRKSPTMPHDWQSVTVRWSEANTTHETPLIWYGEYLWLAEIPAPSSAGIVYSVCAVDAAGNEACSESAPTR